MANGNHQLMIRLGLVDSYIGLILPASFSAFGTFLLRQFMLTIPSSFDEAAGIDGASHWQVYWRIILPLARPGLIALAIFTFVGNYHSFFWPLVMLKSTHRYTLPVGLLYFDSSLGQDNQSAHGRHHDVGAAAADRVRSAPAPSGPRHSARGGERVGWRRRCHVVNRCGTGTVRSSGPAAGTIRPKDRKFSHNDRRKRKVTR